MTGLSKGYVIPRIKAGDQTASVVARDGTNRAAGAAAGCDSRQLLFKQFASIYRARCTHCKDFHDIKSYCFRLKTLHPPEYLIHLQIIGCRSLQFSHYKLDYLGK